MGISYVNWLREKVGTQKMFLPFATVVVRDDHGRILLQRRTDFDFWGLPGGVLELDEDLETCARRELLEETGLEVGPLRLVGVYTDPRYDVTYPNGDQVQQCTFCFEGQVNGGQMRPDGVETSNQLFLDGAALIYYPMPLWYKDMITDALKHGPPAFKLPFASKQTTDQIKTVRRFIGTDLYSGISASAIISREDGRILLLQHVGESTWRPPAGFCELGENVAQTAVREVWERTGLEIMPERIIAVHGTPELNVIYPNGDRIRNVGIIFKSRLLEGILSLDHKEVTKAAWMTAEVMLAHVPESRRWFYSLVLDHLYDGHIVC